jgi:ABC-2 type transport system permease protein
MTCQGDRPSALAASRWPTGMARKRPDPLGAPDWLLPLAPLAGFAFLSLSFLAWRAGVTRYASTGS